MQPDKFPFEVAERLKWYVYRLIDPRNGETFYVGKGKDNRVFNHAKGALIVGDDEDAADLKSQRIKDITAAGAEVAHVIHRHGIDDPKIALQIEAALIDAYPGLTNRAGGHGSGDYGVRHVLEIIAEYAAKPFEVGEPLILISIAKSFDDDSKDILRAVSGFWRIDPSKAGKYNLVLAHRRGRVVGAFRPRRWLPATSSNFPWLDTDIPYRHGFVGDAADPEISSFYVGKRVPEEYRAKGASNPIRFVDV
jgi:hypothetical protein